MTFVRRRTDERNVVHGHAKQGQKTPTYRVWLAMIQRCTNPKRTNWPHYGGRGINICERWMKFENFLADMGVRPDGRTLDRIDVNGNYEPGNCRWATQSQQVLNRRPYQPPAIPKLDLTGMTFGRWTVVEYAGKRGRSNAWSCRCICGNTGVVPAGILNAKHSRSCGCLRIDVISRVRQQRISEEIMEAGK